MTRELYNFFCKPQNRKKRFFFKVNHLNYQLNFDQYKYMSDNKITYKILCQRLNAGWRLEEASVAPIFLNPEDYRHWLRIKEWKKENQIKKKKHIEKPKPWLKSVPQKVEPSTWFKYLSKNDIFVKVKK